MVYFFFKCMWAVFSAGIRFNFSQAHKLKTFFAECQMEVANKLFFLSLIYSFSYTNFFELSFWQSIDNTDKHISMPVIDPCLEYSNTDLCFMRVCVRV